MEIDKVALQCELIKVLKHHAKENDDDPNTWLVDVMGRSINQIQALSENTPVEKMGDWMTREYMSALVYAIALNSIAPAFIEDK